MDENVICADARFKPLFENNILARPAAFRFRIKPSDFLFTPSTEHEASLSDCSSLVVYQSNLVFVPEKFSTAKQHLQNVRVLQDIPSKQYPLLLSNADLKSPAREKITSLFVDA